MPPRKRARGADQSATASDVAPPLRLTGGHAEKPRTVDKYRSGKCCDAELVAADGTPAKAHRLVLMGGSAYFEALYGTSNWADAGSPLELATVPAAALKSCLEYLYTGECAVADEAALVEVLEAAGYLQIEALIEAAANAMRSRLGPSNCLTVWGVAERQNLTGLVDAAITTACAQFVAATAEPAWAQAPVARVHTLLADDRIAAHEEAVYKAAIAWLRTNQLDAEAAAAAVLEHVRFALLPHAFVRETVDAEPLLDPAPMQRLLRCAFEDKAFGVVSTQTQPREGTTRLLVLGGRGFGNVLATVAGFSFASNTWEALQSMNSARWSHGATAMGGKVFAIGGIIGSNGNGTKSMECYDPAANTWETLPPMSTAREAPGVVAMGGLLYAMGGYDEDSESDLTTVERFDPATKTWEILRPMSKERCFHGVAVVSGRIYAVGGQASHETLSSMERFDPMTNVWETLPPMSNGRYLHGVVALRGKLYVMGGDGDSPPIMNSVVRFDPETNEWEALPPMSTGRCRFGVAAVGGKIYVVGGEGHDGDDLTSIECFDPDSGVWETLPPLASAVKGAAVVAI